VRSVLLGRIIRQGLTVAAKQMPLEEVAAMAHAGGMPVMVDTAAELPELVEVVIRQVREALSR
jgi:seryl-tRNA(Sec) selenium transferase